MPGKPSRITPIQNFRQARQAAARARDYDRRNVAIGVAVQPVIVVLLLVVLRCDFGTAVKGLGAVDLGFLGLISVPVIWMNFRNDPATGLAAVRGTTAASVDEVSLAMRRTFNCEPQQTERDGRVLLACETSRSNLSYGEWIVLSLVHAKNNVVTVEALSWNTSPTVTFGVNRRNLHRLAAAIPLRDMRTLTHNGSGNVVADWIAAGILAGKPTPRPAWHSGMHAA